MLDAYIYDGLRTPFGRHAGALAPVRPDDLLAGVIRALIARNPFAPEDFEDLVAGNTNQAGEDARNLARHAGLLAGAMVIGAARPGPSVGWSMVVWAWLSTTSLASVDGVVNLATGGDYMFLRRPPAGWNPLRIMGPWPVYVVVAFLICPVILAVVELPAWGLRGANRRS